MWEYLIGNAWSQLRYDGLWNSKNPDDLRNAHQLDNLHHQMNGMRAMSQEEIAIFQFESMRHFTAHLQEQQTKAKIIHEHCLTGKPFDKAEPI